MIRIDCGKYITNLSITVDRCTPALAAVIKQSCLFADFLDLETNISKFTFFFYKTCFTYGEI